MVEPDTAALPSAIASSSLLSRFPLLESCWDAKEDNVEGDGTTLADASIDCGRCRRGNENDLASAANDENPEVEVEGLVVAAEGWGGVGSSGVVGEDMSRSFIGGSGGDGVLGGGG